MWTCYIMSDKDKKHNKSRYHIINYLLTHYLLLVNLYYT